MFQCTAQAGFIQVCQEVGNTPSGGRHRSRRETATVRRNAKRSSF